MLSIRNLTWRRKKKDLELSTMLEESKTLIKTANAPIFAVDKNLAVTVWNSKAAEITQVSAEKALGQPFLDFIDPDSHASVTEVLSRALTGEFTSNYELPLTTRDGDLLTLLLNATPQQNIKGKIVGAIGIAQDITEKKSYAKLSILM